MPRLIWLFLILFALNFSISSDSLAQENAKKKISKRLPKKIKVPEGFIPVDPSKVNVSNQLYDVAETKLQEALVKDEKFQGVIQFVKGEVLWADTSRQPDPQFKSILRKGDVLRIGANSFVKIISQKRCVGVVHGPSTLSTAISKEDDVWQIEDSTVRWICPGKSEEHLRISKRPLTLFASEIYYHKNKLLVVSGEPQAENGSLDSKKVYVGKSTHWRPLRNQPHIHDLWSMNRETPAPVESQPWEEPEKATRYRFSLGPQLGWVTFNYEDANIRNAIPNDLKGGRITGYFYGEKKAYSLSFNFKERTSSAHSSSGPNYNYTGSMKTEVISFGVRFSPDRDWSYTARIGVGGSELRPEYNNGSSFYSHIVQLGIVELGGGVDRVFRIEGWDWLAFILSGELQIVKSLGSAKFKDQGSSGGDPLYSVLEKNGFSSVDFVIHAAPLIYF
ncbi:MAG: hypothetical protein A4S09_09290 [Proteobacteria bacterium SG_bin7]|nr:MAG: hypothetical protein A4S09_09290 [Proteobacteria bacterium SG_bin7]